MINLGSPELTLFQMILLVLIMVVAHLDSLSKNMCDSEPELLIRATGEYSQIISLTDDMR